MSAAPTVWTDVKLRIGSPALAAIAPLVMWPNMAFDRPDAGDTGSRWLAVETAADTFKPYELGAGLWSEDGQIFVHVLTVAGTGTDLETSVSGAVAEAFRYNHTSVIYRRMSKALGGPGTEDGMWWRTTITIDYHFEAAANPPV